MGGRPTRHEADDLLALLNAARADLATAIQERDEARKLCAAVVDSDNAKADKIERLEDALALARKKMRLAHTDDTPHEKAWMVLRDRLKADLATAQTKNAKYATLLMEARAMFHDGETHDRLRSWWDRQVAAIGGSK